MADTRFTDRTAARVMLRRFRPSDLEAFVGYRSSPLVARFQSRDAPTRSGRASG